MVATKQWINQNVMKDPQENIDEMKKEMRISGDYSLGDDSLFH